MNGIEIVAKTTLVKMLVENQCSVVRLTARQLKQYKRSPEDFCVLDESIVGTCGKNHRDEKAAQKCFAKFFYK